MKLTLVTPAKKLLSEVEVDEVVVPAHRGELDILPGHSPLVSTLKAGTLKVKEKGSDKYKSASICWGYLEVAPDEVIVLAENAEWEEEIDKARASEQLKIAEERLQQAGLSPDDYTVARRKLEKEQSRIDTLTH